MLDCSGSGVIAGVDWVTSHKSDRSAANMSFGGGVSNSLDTAVQDSIHAA